jgi:hypothetical protein
MPTDAKPSAAPRAEVQSAAQQNAQTREPTSATPPAGNISAAEALREVQALVAQGRVGAARVLAEDYLKRIPSGPEAAQIKSLTGVHPHP